LIFDFVARLSHYLSGANGYYSSFKSYNLLIITAYSRRRAHSSYFLRYKDTNFFWNRQANRL